MRIYTYSEARKELSELLNRARREGGVEIRRRDGQSFVVRPLTPSGSPLDVPGIEAGISRQEIVDLVRHSRRSTSAAVQRHAQEAVVSLGSRVASPPLAAQRRALKRTCPLSTASARQETYRKPSPR